MLRGSLDSLAQDLRYTWRGMRRSPSFTAVAVLTLAIGIGVNAAVFTVTNAVLFRGFRQVENDRIVYVDSARNGRGCCASYADFDQWRRQARSFSGMGAVADLQINLSDDSGLSEHADATRISTAAFSLLGVRPILGRDFVPLDEAPGAAPVAMLRYGLWERRYGKDPGIIGQTIRINGTPTTVIGVMGAGFSFPQNQDVWIPLVETPELDRQAPLWFAFGRLADGATIDAGRAEMAIIGRRLEREFPKTNQGLTPRVRTFREFFIGDQAPAIYGAMWGAVGFVLLIACANLANLTLSRAIGRSRELSVRLALGASRGRLVRQFLVESVLLSGMGGAVGWWMAVWGVRAYELFARPSGTVGGSYFDNILDYSLDYRVFVYLVTISVGAGLLFGLAPASRLSKLDIITALKYGGRSANAGGRGRQLSGYLVIAEMALAVVLLAGAGVLLRSFLKLYTADLGVRPANVLSMYLNLPDARYAASEERLAFYSRLKTQLEAVPGVELVSVGSAPPVGGSRRVPYELAGSAPIDDERRPTLSAMTIGPAYFRTLGAVLLSGREFTDDDGGPGRPTAIVNEQFAAQQWPGEDALGRRLHLFDGTSDGWVTIVGVASNIVQNDASRQEFDPLVYLPYRRKPTAATWVFARTRVPPASLYAAVRQRIEAMDPDLPIWMGPFTLADRLAWGYAFTASIATLFLIFAAIALLMASVGLYAVVAHAVSLRTQEIGVRLAIGATAHDILALVFTQGMRPLAIGVAAGLAASFVVNRLLQAELVRVSPADPLTLIVATMTLAAAAALGCLIPARRAMRVDPVVALRHE